LVKARELIRAGNHFGAIRYLEKLEKQGVDSLEARALLQQARTELAQNTDTLLATGDSLYREGKVKEALALWQAALAINPFDATARKKSERAMRVLANMDALREEKPPEARPNKAL
jgi:tetratricopeptide (TPR) repeat protein